MRYIDDLLAYSRPMGYTEDKRSIPILDYLPKDPNYMGFHKRNGSKLVCVVEGGSSPLDACAGGYAFIMCYTTAMKPDKEFQAVLDKIGKSVMGMLVAG
jgi:hypothetical protein